MRWGAVLFQMLDCDGSGRLDAGKLVGGLRTVAGQSLGSDHLQEVARLLGLALCLCARRGMPGRLLSWAHAHAGGGEPAGRA